MSIGAALKPFTPVWEVVTTVAGLENYGDMAGNNRCRPFAFDLMPGSIHVIWDGTTTGTLTYYVSNNHDPQDTTNRWNGDWESINSLITPALVAPAGAPGTHFINLTKIKARFLYIGFVRSAGSGKTKAVVSRSAVT